MKIQINEKSYFAYYRDMEYIAIVCGMLGDHLDGRICREVYDEAFIAKIRKKHRELAEFLNTLSVDGLIIFEFYLAYKGEAFNLEEYRRHMENMDTIEFLFKLFGYYTDKEEIKAALLDDELLGSLLDEGKTQMNSFVSLKRIINHRNEFIQLFYDCIEDIRIPELESYLDQHEKKLPSLLSEMEEKLAIKAPNEVTKETINKCVSNEREYDSYGFIPLCMLPRETVTYHYKDQVVLYSKRIMEARKQSLNTLKIVADDTRIRIIDLFSENGFANGKRICKKLQLAPSTVSHHMEQLVE